LVIEYWNLKFVCNLVLGAWDFIYSIDLANCRKRGKTIEAPTSGAAQMLSYARTRK